ncbi:MAG TPA: bis(5'-nucleosyl)-tetraphosphatase (symmetrical) YqeK [Syntrophomonadaceae bacterium]|nr:bis(5'-nucleosyl)-tetraphosphatase (symmetrical) YqeK [Syntrophomonadaceae bacterium]HPR92482.1 bis(5'-nucleosyl)-tetraphosphatase (symmetrical) YqeK [Syntrophomonadaceae bacterium]
MLTKNDIMRVVQKQLSPELFRHVSQVAQTAETMAELYQENREKAYLAGILHDYAKEKPVAELLTIAGENGLLVDDVFRQVPFLLHAPVGACLIKKELGIDDEAILNAISNHTLGRPFMTRLEKIIFLADMIEPDRNFPEVEKLRSLSRQDLDRAMLAALDSTLEYCLQQKRIIHPQTIATRNYFLLL